MLSFCICFTIGNLMDEKVIETFSREYVVDKKLVEKYIQHLKYLDIKKRKREEAKKNNNNSLAFL